MCVCFFFFWYNMQLTEIILENFIQMYHSLIAAAPNGAGSYFDPVNLLFSISFIAKQTENNRWRLNAASGAFRFGNWLTNFLF